MDLTKLSVTGYEGDISSGFSLQLLDNLGQAQASYAWQDYSKKGKTYYGWLDSNANKMIEEGEVILPAGKGLWVVCAEAGLKLSCNGEVLTAGQAIQLQNNGSMVANPYPVDVNLVDMWGSGYDGDISSGFSLQLLDNLGQAQASYAWQDYSKKGKTYYGWLDSNANTMVARDDNVLIGAGKSVWVVCQLPDGAEWFLNFPAILQDKAE